jgi:hypothetical protein
MSEVVEVVGLLMNSIRQAVVVVPDGITVDRGDLAVVKVRIGVVEVVAVVELLRL